MPNNKENISFINQTSVTIVWNATRQNLFGVFPKVNIYVQDPTGVHYKALVQPYPNAAPPSFTQLNIDLPGPTTGFISIM